MIDWDQEIELDDGRKVTVQSKEGNGGAYVYVTGPWKRDQYVDRGTDLWFYESDGSWAGGSKTRYFYIVNVARPEMYIPEDWS